MFKNGKFVCSKCGCTEYVIKNNGGRAVDEETGRVIGEYDYYVPTCKNCGQPFYLEWVEDKNRKIEAEFDRQHFHLLSLAQIRALPRHYGLSRRDFAFLMDIHYIYGEPGDEDYYEYNIWSGDIPPDEEEQKLEAIYKDPNEFIRIAESNKALYVTEMHLVSEEVFEKAIAKARTLKKRDF